MSFSNTFVAVGKRPHTSETSFKKWVDVFLKVPFFALLRFITYLKTSLGGTLSNLNSTERLILSQIKFTLGQF